MSGPAKRHGASPAPPAPAAVGSLVEVLLRWAEEKPEATAYSFLSGGRLERSISYAELARRAASVAAHLGETARRGDRALLLLPSGIEYVEALLGCFIAGVVAVPLLSPQARRSLERIGGVVADCDARLAITSASILDGLKDAAVDDAGLAGLRWIAVDAVATGPAPDALPAVPAADDLAFLQYTSGSTRSPRGVMVTHRNLIENSAMFQAGFGHDHGVTTGGWLPFHHDMGLIGMVLQGLWLGGPCVLMSPMDFLRRPLRWLQAISEHRIHTSGAPNFAFDLCADRVNEEQRSALDLSCWRVAFNGAEPVRAATVKRFAATFAAAGFDERAMCPAYGLAEATLFVTGSPATELPKLTVVDARAMEMGTVRVMRGPHHASGAVPGDDGDRSAAGDTNDDGGRPVVAARELVACGRPRYGMEVRIVDPGASAPVPDGHIGEIWVSHVSVARGYWGDPDASRDTFAGRLAGEPERTWLRTGDLGILVDGELYITGRSKDVIIIDGRNHYPQDLEFTAIDSHAAVRDCVAVSVDEADRERLVMLAEIDVRWKRRHPSIHDASPFDADEVETALRRAIAEEHDLRIHALGLLKPGQILKTTSGKVRRADCGAAWLAGSLVQVGDPPDRPAAATPNAAAIDEST